MGMGTVGMKIVRAEVVGIRTIDMGITGMGTCGDVKA